MWGKLTLGKQSRCSCGDVVDDCAWASIRQHKSDLQVVRCNTGTQHQLQLRFWGRHTGHTGQHIRDATGTSHIPWIAYSRPEAYGCVCGGLREQASRVKTVWEIPDPFSAGQVDSRRCEELPPLDCAQQRDT